MLEDGGNGDDKESAEEAERAQKRQEVSKAQATLPDPAGENRKT
jgi:hypothetical protein